MTLACLMIYALESISIHRIMVEYSDDAEIDEFICRAPLDKVLIVRGKVITAILMLGMASICSVLRIG